MKRSALDEDTFLRFFQTLDERQARLCAAERALAIGRGGITLVSRVTGLSYPTIHKGITELRNTAATLTTGRIRRPGGGRKKVEVVDPAVLPILQQVVESSTAGSPMDALRWRVNIRVVQSVGRCWRARASRIARSSRMVVARCT